MSTTAATGSPSIIRAVCLGVIAGVMAGLFGVGGGVVLVPGLILLTGMVQHHAHATSLAAIIVTASAALLPFALEGAVAWPAAAALAVGALTGAVGGADIMRRVPAGRLRILFGLFLVAVAIRLVLAATGQPTDAVAEEGPVGLGTAGLVALLLAGLATGLLSGLLGVGGGVVMVPVMVLGFGFGQHLAEGTSLAVIVPTAIIGAWRHSRSGYTRWRTGFVVGAGGLIGGLAGGTLAQRIPADALQIAFAALLLITGARLSLRRHQTATDGTGRDGPDGTAS